MINHLIRNNPFLDQDNKLVDRSFRWTQNVSKLQVLTGEGSPEGVIEAEITTRYMDTTGTVGNTFYIKFVADISGDRTQGWRVI